MTTVRDHFAPLLPAGMTLRDDAIIWVEKVVCPVGPAGSQARTLIEQAWPGETFSSTDELVFETDRLRAGDELVIPGTVTSDNFNGAVIDQRIWTPYGDPVLDGQGNLLLDRSVLGKGNSLVLLHTGPVAGRSVIVEWEKFGNPSSGLSYPYVKVAKQGDANRWVQVRAAAGKLDMRQAQSSQYMAAVTLDATAMRYWKISATSNQVTISTSPDSLAWTDRWVCPVAPDWLTGPCVYSIGNWTSASGGQSGNPDLAASFAIA